MARVDSQKLVLAVQSPREAVYALFLGDEANATFDQEKLTIVDTGDGFSEQTGLSFQAAIIGESHFVRLKRVKDGKILFTELLACVDPLRLDFKPTAVRRLLDNDNFEIRRGNREDGLIVETSAVIHPKTHNRRIFAPPNCVQKGQGLSSTYLEKSFPGPQKPRTIVSVVLYGNHMKIRTVHEYVTADHFIEPLTSETVVSFRH